MAYVSGYNPYDENDKNNAGGILGTGGEMGGGAPVKTSAGTPGGWTNIQDYLNANKGDMTNVNSLRNKATGIIGKGTEELNKQKSNLAALPTAQGYDATKLNEYLGSNDYGKIRGATKQQLATQTPTAQELVGYSPLEDQVSGLKEGDFGSIEKFFGDRETTPNYTPGMKSFDKMLLQGNPYVQKDFVPEIKGMYENQYKKPLEAARTERDTAKTAASQGMGEASESWKTGINQYLGGEKNKVNQLLAQQQQQEAEAADLTKSEWDAIYGPARQSYLNNLKTTNPEEYQRAVMASPIELSPGFNYMNYAERTGNTTPNIGTAASSYAGSNDLADYNALVNLINEYGGKEELLMPNSGYSAGSWRLKGLPFA